MYANSWYDMVTPSQMEMTEFLRHYLGVNWWRMPPKRWHDIYMQHRGLCGMKPYQRGFIQHLGFWKEVAAGTNPNLQAITHTQTSVAPTPARIQMAYDSDGSIEHYFGVGLASVVYTDLTTQSDDTNDHTNDWWPDQPDVNEGLNWDIRTTNETIDETDGQADFYRFEDGVPTERSVDTWYLLDTVSNDHADASRAGALTVLHRGGGAKTPAPGSCTYTGTVEIRVTTSGAAVTSHVLTLDATTT